MLGCCMSCKWRNENPYESCIDCLHGDGYVPEDNDDDDEYINDIDGLTPYFPLTYRPLPKKGST